jgi:hypothetical protein
LPDKFINDRRCLLQVKLLNVQING